MKGKEDMTTNKLHKINRINKLDRQVEAGRKAANLKIAELPNVACKVCGGTLFQPVNQIRVVSPIVSPTGKQEFVTQIVYLCANLSCGEVMRLADPETWTTKRGEQDQDPDPEQGEGEE